MEKRATIIHSDRDHVLGTWHQTVITVWRGSVTLEAAQRVNEVCQALLSRPGAVTLLFVVEAGSPPPQGKAREEMAKWSRDSVTKMARSAVIAEGNAFRSALVRGVGLALSMMMPHAVPFKFFSRVEDGISHLWPGLPQEPGVTDALRAAVADMRAEFDKAFPK